MWLRWIFARDCARAGWELMVWGAWRAHPDPALGHRAGIAIPCSPSYAQLLALRVPKSPVALGTSMSRWSCAIPNACAHHRALADTQSRGWKVLETGTAEIRSYSRILKISLSFCYLLKISLLGFWVCLVLSFIINIVVIVWGLCVAFVF